MPHISKKKLEEKFLKDLYFELIHSLERAGRRGESKKVLDGLFTQTEKVMFAKRLAVIDMLSRKVPIHTIAETLSMSPSTIDLASLQFEIGTYNGVISHGLTKSGIRDVIEFFMNAGGLMPSIDGKKRWKSLDNAMRKERIDERIKRIAERNKAKKEKKKFLRK